MFAGGERGIFFEDFSTPCAYQSSVTVFNSLSRRAIIPFDSDRSNFAHPSPESAEHTRSSALRPSFSAKQLGRSSPPASSDRKSTRLNSSHGYISYAVFCLKKKKNINNNVHL